MRMLELFCGTKSISKEFKKVGFSVVSLDFDPQFQPGLLDGFDSHPGTGTDTTIIADILTIPDDYFSGFDVVWASPPCNAFSVAVIGKNWYHDHTPKNDTARLGLKILEKTVAIINHVNPKMFFIENPRGKMRRMPIMQGFQRDTVTYCQYGDLRQKPTDIWHNTNWHPRPRCSPSDSCHEAAPRGSKTGTQGIKGSRDRAIIPAELCRELALYAANELR
jgi:site-specific DNA-cytosine methylase